MKAELLLAEIRPTEYLSCFDIFFHVSDFFSCYFCVTVIQGMLYIWFALILFL